MKVCGGEKGSLGRGGNNPLDERLEWGGGDGNVYSECGDGCTTLNILKAIKLYTLNEWIVWYVNCISIKLLKKKRKRIH